MRADMKVAVGVVIYLLFSSSSDFFLLFPRLDDGW